ncbi:hypothetical protein [Acuticoccus sp. I52.16.1]|uniref:hypothetical protein n=1 Tax=Acuticoccus sp. I52.16.1 TaxID=2928472 RepID=UPI001FD479EC|nr:hypothetical protein [Acuticoccus sp. I52.16.1]UOM36021.1 hypothetical protein MRB58_07445 [Acuticoccus sp. I52.16.1]
MLVGNDAKTMFFCKAAAASPALVFSVRAKHSCYMTLLRTDRRPIRERLTLP